MPSEKEVMELFRMYKMLSKEDQKLVREYLDQLLAEQERETK